MNASPESRPESELMRVGVADPAGTPGGAAPDSASNPTPDAVATPASDRTSACGDACSCPRWRAYLPWLLPLALLALMAWRPLAVPDEGRYAEVGRWMFLRGDWLVQRLDGIPFFHKPPLLYWLEAGAFALFGVSTWVARLVIAAHAVLMWALMWACARHWAGAQVARRAAWMLGASAAFLIGGQYVNHDMLVACWISVAILCFARALLHEAPAGDAVAPHRQAVHRGWAYAGFAACAFGVLSKGLIGLLLPGLVLALWVAWTRQWRKLPALPWFSGAALFALIAVPWFVLAERATPGMLAYLFGEQQFGRFQAASFNNGQPVWFYLLAVAVLMFPWAFLLPLDAWRRLRARAADAQATSTQINTPLTAHTVTPPWVSLCWLWVVAILGFFSIPHSKLIGYALPVVPAVALLAAQAWPFAGTRRACVAWALALLVGVGTVVAVQPVIERVIRFDSSAPLAAVLHREQQPGERVVVLGEYPYDLPFLAQLTEPMAVLKDWDWERVHAGDNWRRELLDGAAFDPVAAARVLQPLERLQGLDREPGVWLVVERASFPLVTSTSHWQLMAEVPRWRLYRSAP